MGARRRPRHEYVSSRVPQAPLRRARAQSVGVRHRVCGGRCRSNRPPRCPGEDLDRVARAARRPRRQSKGFQRWAPLWRESFGQPSTLQNPPRSQVRAPDSGEARRPPAALDTPPRRRQVDRVGRRVFVWPTATGHAAGVWTLASGAHPPFHPVGRGQQIQKGAHSGPQWDSCTTANQECSTAAPPGLVSLGVRTNHSIQRTMRYFDPVRVGSAPPRARLGLERGSVGMEWEARDSPRPQRGAPTRLSGCSSAPWIERTPRRRQRPSLLYVIQLPIPGKLRPPDPPEAETRRGRTQRTPSWVRTSSAQRAAGADTTCCTVRSMPDRRLPVGRELLPPRVVPPLVVQSHSIYPPHEADSEHHASRVSELTSSKVGSTETSLLAGRLAFESFVRQSMTGMQI